MKCLKNSILVVLIFTLLSTINPYIVFASDVEGISNIADTSDNNTVSSINKVNVNVSDVSTKTP